ncbi:Energy-coupling factor transporter ATP-binding protein EcfA2 [Sporomusa ovata DSM 2662]|uniref:ATPase component of general energizing module of ECF transporters n=1 Tax=Sporomusa ovata TaxID=2378 RepID=A0A0U1KSE4_9FIRM|nr:energy-coupling factor transporter ATPase [Sporomusa ovata]EQB26254.1 ABC-type cobalt transport system, ATPase component [Sporomusa ovata DSM 2662]CQR70331.1 ATPase component of general energizing module of ECF transporters [Sporomusa ovata]
MTQNSIELINVTKEYSIGTDQKKVALDNVSLAINQGEFVAIIGMNGSGKSTVARLINGLAMPTGGKVMVNGLDTRDTSLLVAIRRNVGMVFQNPDNQIISTIVEEDIAFGPENLGLPHSEVRARAEWAMKVLDIEHLRLHAPHLLSGGQKQRVAIASALALRPTYLVLDEPTSMLDSAGKKELIQTLVKLNREFGITIILISHHMEDVIHANRIIVLNNGQIFLEGTPDDIFNTPEKINPIGFHTPDIIQLTRNLTKRGHRLQNNLYTVETLVEALCQL